ncbi:MAG: hypothetical protein V3T02_07775 [Alphaproteobacteria bacterium]
MPRFAYPAAALALAATLAMSGAMSGVAHAQKSAPKGEIKQSRQAERLVRRFDTNEDGKVTLKEITAYQKRLMSAVDVNGDGTLSDKEFRRGARMIRRFSTTTMFDLLDTNGDRKLSADEVTGPTTRWFTRYDANANGVMEAGELPERRRGRGGRRGHRR